jgi:hypothetical protein
MELINASFVLLRSFILELVAWFDVVFQHIADDLIWHFSEDLFR